MRSDNKPEDPHDDKSSFALNRTAAQIFLLAVGAALIALGIYRGEAMEILGKAVVVCLECIGIG